MWVYSAVLGLLGLMMPFDNDPSLWSGYADKLGQEPEGVQAPSDYTYKAFQKQGLKPSDLFGEEAQQKYAEWLKQNPAK